MRKPPIAAAHSSGVRSGLVVRRQWDESASPVKRPAVISVLPISSARSMVRPG